MSVRIFAEGGSTIRDAAERAVSMVRSTQDTVVCEFNSIDLEARSGMPAEVVIRNWYDAREKRAREAGDARKADLESRIRLVLSDLKYSGLTVWQGSQRIMEIIEDATKGTT